MINLFKKLHAKDKRLKTELVRAHVMIVLLAAALITLLAIAPVSDLAVSPVLTMTAIVLLAFVGLISLTVAVALFTKKK